MSRRSRGDQAVSSRSAANAANLKLPSWKTLKKHLRRLKQSSKLVALHFSDISFLKVLSVENIGVEPMTSTVQA